MARPTLTAAFRKAALDFPGRNLAILVNLSYCVDSVGLF